MEINPSSFIFLIKEAKVPQQRSNFERIRNKSTVQNRFNEISPARRMNREEEFESYKRSINNKNTKKQGRIQNKFLANNLNMGKDIKIKNRKIRKLLFNIEEIYKKVNLDEPKYLFKSSYKQKDYFKSKNLTFYNYYNSLNLNLKGTKSIFGRNIKFRTQNSLSEYDDKNDYDNYMKLIKNDISPYFGDPSECK